MSDRKVSDYLARQLVEAKLWALVCCGCVMLPIIMNPGNLGPIAIAYGFVIHGFPALCIGFILGIIFGSQIFVSRLLLAVLGGVVLSYMFDYVKTY